MQQSLRAHAETIARLDALIPDIVRLSQLMQESLTRGGKILLLGNGGSAADSQHIAAELVGRFHKERRGLAAIALTTDTSILTSVGNDYGYDHVFARQVEALCRPEDVLIGISTSGNSANVLRAIEAGREIGATTVALTGEGGGKLGALCNLTLAVPSHVTARVQEAHILIGHILCELIDNANAPD
ncbi:MAG: phosphoheptose isomerase [Methylophilales bacterium RIFCSPHIGHO2_02_FULL_57_10]|nr:MAG: phosphoheptose isomerase [Methylophilales bacterium RIFCSPHIGHO2_02_FULL_57_10]